MRSAHHGGLPPAALSQRLSFGARRSPQYLRASASSSAVSPKRSASLAAKSGRFLNIAQLSAQLCPSRAVSARSPYFPTARSTHGGQMPTRAASRRRPSRDRTRSALRANPGNFEVALLAGPQEQAVLVVKSIGTRYRELFDQPPARVQTQLTEPAIPQQQALVKERVGWPQKELRPRRAIRLRQCWGSRRRRGPGRDPQPARPRPGVPGRARCHRRGLERPRPEGFVQRKGPIGDSIGAELAAAPRIRQIFHLGGMRLGAVCARLPFAPAQAFPNAIDRNNVRSSRASQAPGPLASLNGPAGRRAWKTPGWR